MNEADIFKAIAPDEWTILGLKLRPFALGHLVLLHRTQSPFVTGGVPDYHALQSAVFICSRSYEEALDGINDPGLPQAMRAWARKVTGERWWRRGSPVNLAKKCAELYEYLRASDVTPVYKAGEGTRKVLVPFVQSVRVKLQSRLGWLDDSTLLNRSWALCKLDFYTLCDLDGVLTLWDDDAQDELKRLREKAVEVDEKLRTGKMEVRWQ